MFNIKYKDKTLHTNLTEEECTDILFELAQEFYQQKLDPNELQLEPTNGKTD